jgi:hypothetical protein
MLCYAMRIAILLLATITITFTATATATDTVILFPLGEIKSSVRTLTCLSYFFLLLCEVTIVVCNRRRCNVISN